MRKYLILFHDIQNDEYRAYASTNNMRRVNHYIHNYLLNNEEALVIECPAGIINHIFKKTHHFTKHLNLTANDRFLTIEEIGLTWKRMKELANESR